MGITNVQLYKYWKKCSHHYNNDASFVAAHLTRCEMDLLRARGWLINGKAAAVFMPECRPDGSYVPEQCDKSTGQCWCVDRNGNELLGTRVSGTPTCTSQSKFACDQLGQCSSEKELLLVILTTVLTAWVEVINRIKCHVSWEHMPLSIKP